MTTPGPMSVGGGAAAHRRRPSINDVARMAGVSHQTVSRFLNDHPLVADHTRDKIGAAIRELDYRPNRSARTLVTGKTRLLGVIVSGRTHSGPAAMMQSIEDAAREQGYALVTRSLPEPRHTLVHVAAEQLLAIGVDGIVVLASAVPDALTGGHSWPVPVVVVQGHAGPGVRAIGFDGTRGAAQAVRHLLEHGHANVWHVAGPAGWWESHQRAAGWCAELLAAGITPRPAVMGDWTAESGYRAGRRLAEDPAVTAIFAANDEMAAGVQSAYRDAGRCSPDTLGIVGFDDHPVAAFLFPPLTTVRTDTSQLGSKVMKLLTMDRNTKAGQSSNIDEDPIVVATQLIVRSSSAPLTHYRRGLETNHQPWAERPDAPARST